MTDDTEHRLRELEAGQEEIRGRLFNVETLAARASGAGNGSRLRWITLAISGIGLVVIPPLTAWIAKGGGP